MVLDMCVHCFVRAVNSNDLSPRAITQHTASLLRRGELEVAATRGLEGGGAVLRRQVLVEAQPDDRQLVGRALDDGRAAKATLDRVDEVGGVQGVTARHYSRSRQDLDDVVLRGQRHGLGEERELGGQWRQLCGARAVLSDAVQ